MKSALLGRAKSLGTIGLALPLLVALAPGCPGLAPGDGGGNGDVAATVRMRSLAFVPSRVTIAQGETVRWVNDDLVPHTTTSGNPDGADAGSLWDSEQLGLGQSFEHTFNEAGEFFYFCETHPFIMRNALIIVEPADTDGGGA